MEDPAVDRREESETVYAEHLDRSTRVWDRWSNWYTLSEKDFAPIRARAIEHAALPDGARVLDIGCGPGVNFAPLTEAVGPGGHIAAIDYSPEMIEKARERVREHDWTHVEVVRADATTADLGGPYDGAIASLSLSVMPDVPRAIANIRASLEPGAPLIVVDVRPFPGGIRRVCNPLLRRFLRWYANWNLDGDVPATLDRQFDEIERIEQAFGGAIYSLIARS